MFSQTPGDAFENACLLELQALKPGNVHVFSDGHGMEVADFVKSAHAAASVIAQPGLAVGQRIFMAVEATWAAAGCNTNLGIILLAAPLIHAVLTTRPVKQVLAELSVEDAVFAFRAITLASPGGLGERSQHDARSVPEVTLLEAMGFASEEEGVHDQIARQYVTGFADVFEFGLERYQQSMARWGNAAWAATAVYLGWLARQPDTHVVRKSGVLGASAATELQKEALLHEQAFLACDNPKNYMGALLKWDAQLKEAGINPGTSADLTVATLMLADVAMKSCIPIMPNYSFGITLDLNMNSSE